MRKVFCIISLALLVLLVDEVQAAKPATIELKEMGNIVSVEGMNKVCTVELDSKYKEKTVFFKQYGETPPKNLPTLWFTVVAENTGCIPIEILVGHDHFFITEVPLGSYCYVAHTQKPYAYIRTTLKPGEKITLPNQRFVNDEPYPEAQNQVIVKVCNELVSSWGGLIKKYRKGGEGFITVYRQLNGKV